MKKSTTENELATNQGNVFTSPSGCSLNSLRGGLGTGEGRAFCSTQRCFMPNGDFHLVTLGLFFLCCVIKGLYDAFSAVGIIKHTT